MPRFLSDYRLDHLAPVNTPVEPWLDRSHIDDYSSHDAAFQNARFKENDVIYVPNGAGYTKAVVASVWIEPDGCGFARAKYFVAPLRATGREWSKKAYWLPFGYVQMAYDRAGALPTTTV